MARRSTTSNPATLRRQKTERALDLIKQGRIRSVGEGRYLAVGYDEYLTTISTCTCPAGQNSIECYHVLAAKILSAPPLSDSTAAWFMAESERINSSSNCTDCGRPKCHLAQDMVVGVEYCGGKGRFGCATSSLRPSFDGPKEFGGSSQSASTVSPTSLQTTSTASSSPDAMPWEDSFVRPPADPGVLSRCVDCGHEALVFAGGFSHCRKCITGGFMRPLRNEVA